jgi:hypothetical protein
MLNFVHVFKHIHFFTDTDKVTKLARVNYLYLNKIISSKGCQDNNLFLNPCDQFIFRRTLLILRGLTFCGRRIEWPNFFYPNLDPTFVA